MSSIFARKKVSARPLFAVNGVCRERTGRCLSLGSLDHPRYFVRPRSPSLRVAILCFDDTSACLRLLALRRLRLGASKLGLPDNGRWTIDDRWPYHRLSSIVVGVSY